MLESGIALQSFDGRNDVIDVASPRVAANVRQVQIAHESYTLPEHLLYGTIGSIAGAADTLLSSMGPLDDRDMEDWAKTNLGRAGQYFVDNRQTVGAIGDIALSFVPATIGMRAVRTGGFLARHAEKMFGARVRPFFSTGLSNQALAQQAADRAVFLARNNRALNLNLDPTFKMLKRSAMKRSAADVLVEGVAADLAVAATMNQSDFLFPDEMSFMNNVAFLGGFNIAFGGISAAAARWTINQQIRRAVGPLVSGSVNPGNLNLIGAVQNVEGQRWHAGTMFAMAADDVEGLLTSAIQSGDTAAQETLSSLQTSYRDRLKNVVQQMGQDAPFPGFTRSTGFSEGGEQVRTMQRVLAQDPTALTQIASLEAFHPGAVVEITGEVQRQMRKLQSELARKRANLRGLMEKQKKRATPKRAEAIEKIKAAGIAQKEQLDRLQKLQFVVYDLDGTISSGVSRADIWHDGERLIRRDNGRSVLDVEGSPLEVLADGSVRVSTAKAPAAGTRIATVDALENFWDWTEKNSASYFQAIGVKDAADLEVKLSRRAPLATDIDPAARDFTLTFQKQLRQSLGAEFGEDVDEVIMYAADATSVKTRPQPSDAAPIPVTVRLDDVVGVDEMGNLLRQVDDTQLMSAGRYVQLSHTEKTAVLDGLQHSLEHLNLSGKNGFGGAISGDSHWTQLDYAREIFNRNLGREDEVVDFIAGFEEFGSLEAMEFASLRSKFMDFQMMRREAAAMLKDNGRDHVYSDLENVARALNLPMSSRGPHAVVRFFEGIQRTDAGELVDLGHLFKDMDELQEAMRVGFDIQEFDQAVNTLGTMMNMPRDARAVVGIGNNEQTMFGISREQVMMSNATEFAGVMERMRSSDNPIVAALMAEIEGARDVLASAKEGLVQLVEGARASGPFMDAITQQNFKVRGLPGVKEVDTISELTNRTNTKLTEDMLKRQRDDLLTAASYQDAFNHLLRRENAGDLTLWSTAVNSLRFGWDVAEQAVLQSGPRGNVWRLKLRNTEKNKSLWARLFPNREFPGEDKAFVPALGTDKPLALTDEAMDGLRATHAIDRETLEAENAILRAKGMRSHAYKPWHVPAKAFHDKERVFILDHTGHVHQVVGGATPEQARALAQQEIATRKKNASARGSSLELRVVSDADMRLYHDAYARAYHDMDDFSRIVNQSGPGTGRQVGEVVETGADFFQSVLEGQLRQFSDLGRRVRLTVMDPELRYLRTMEAAANPKPGDNVFSLAANQLVGIPGQSANRHISKAYQTIEHAYDSFFAGLFNGLSSIKGTAKPRGSVEAEFEQMGRKLGAEYRPYDTMEDFIEGTMKIKLPQTLKRHGALLNEITTALTIRVADMGMAAVNILSLGATLPPVTKMLQRLPDESAEQHMKRIAAWGSVTPGGVAHFQPGRAAVDGMMFMFSEEGKAVRQWAAKKGYFDQFAAEQVDIYARTGEAFLPGLLREFTSKASWFTDQSEIWARMVPFMTFYNIGKKGLGLTDDAAGIFAHSHANSVIADFRPTNRPYIFQGATGMPLGLFTTFMFNYLQRTFHMLETRQIGALMQQMGLQSLLFGTESVPLWNEYMDVFAANWDGDYKIADRFNDALGHETASWVLNGTLSNMLGMSINQRAAIGLPAQVTNPGPESIPGLRLMGRSVEAMGKAYDAVKNEGEINLGRMAEIIATGNFNKALSNAIEIGQGYALDTRMSIIENDTRKAIGVGARAFGFKPLAAEELREENRRQSVTERLRSDRKKILGQTLRALARQGALEQDNIDRALEQYIEAGGKADAFKRFFMSQIVKGSTNKIDLEIMEALKQNHDQNRIARLIFLMED